MVKMNHFIVIEKRPRHITGMFVFKVIVKNVSLVHNRQRWLIMIVLLTSSDNLLFQLATDWLMMRNNGD